MFLYDVRAPHVILPLPFRDKDFRTHIPTRFYSVLDTSCVEKTHFLPFTGYIFRME